MTKKEYPGWLEIHPYLQALFQVMPFAHRLLHQGTRPDDEQLLDKLGIEKEDEVLFFAAYHADWATAIAKQGPEVTYSDLSEGLVELIRKDSRAQHFSKIIQADGAEYPDKPNQYDWSVSFEPVPMARHGTLYAALERGMLNRKGVKLIARVTKSHPDALVRFACDYGIKLEADVSPIECRRKYSFSRKKIDHVVFTLRTDDELRARVISNLQNQEEAYVDSPTNR